MWKRDWAESAQSKRLSRPEEASHRRAQRGSAHGDHKGAQGQKQDAQQGGKHHAVGSKLRIMAKLHRKHRGDGGDGEYAGKFAVSFGRKIWYTCLAASSAHFKWEGGEMNAEF